MAAKPRKQQVEPGWLNKGQMASSCGISVQAFDAWNVDPVARIGRNVYFRVSDVLANRLASQQRKFEAKAAESAPRGDDLTLQERLEKLALTREQREGQALKNAQTRRELAPVQVIEWVLSKTGSQISALFDAIPPKLMKLGLLKTASQAEVLKRELVKAQNAASRVTVDLDEYYERDGEGDS